MNEYIKQATGQTLRIRRMAHI